MRCPRRVTHRESSHFASAGMCRYRTSTKRHIQAYLSCAHSITLGFGHWGESHKEHAPLADLLGAAPELLIAVYLSSR